MNIKRHACISVICIALTTSTSALAQNIIRTTAPIANQTIQHNWSFTEPRYSSWSDVGGISNCSNWSPLANTVGLGIQFTQTATDCDQNQSRTVQARQVSEATGEFRDAGDPTEEFRLIAASLTIDSIGILETWLAAAPVYSAWSNAGAVYGCTNWSPATSTVAVGVGFTQHATDCKQNQKRTRQDREQESTTFGGFACGRLTVPPRSNAITSARPRACTAPRLMTRSSRYWSRWRAISPSMRATAITTFPAIGRATVNATSSPIC